MNHTYRPHLSRSVVQQYPCPKCHASVSDSCRGYNGAPRLSNHIERVHLAEQSGAGSPVVPHDQFVLAFAKTFLEIREHRTLHALTWKEETLAMRALEAMPRGSLLLRLKHFERKSLEQIAANWPKPIDQVAKWYEAAVLSLAQEIDSRLHGACLKCLRNMPEAAFDRLLRCSTCGDQLARESRLSREG